MLCLGCDLAGGSEFCRFPQLSLEVPGPHGSHFFASPSSGYSYGGTTSKKHFHREYDAIFLRKSFQEFSSCMGAAAKGDLFYI